MPSAVTIAAVKAYLHIACLIHTTIQVKEMLLQLGTLMGSFNEVNLYAHKNSF